MISVAQVAEISTVRAYSAGLEDYKRTTTNKEDRTMEPTTEKSSQEACEGREARRSRRPKKEKAPKEPLSSSRFSRLSEADRRPAPACPTRQRVLGRPRDIREGPPHWPAARQDSKAFDDSLRRPGPT